MTSSPSWLTHPTLEAEAIAREAKTLAGRDRGDVEQLVQRLIIRLTENQARLGMMWSR